MLKWSFAGQLVKITCFPPAWLLCCSWWDSNAYQIHSNNLFQLKACPSLVGHSDGLCSYIYQRVKHLWAFHVCVSWSFSSSWTSLDSTVSLHLPPLCAWSPSGGNSGVEHLQGSTGVTETRSQRAPGWAQGPHEFPCRPALKSTTHWAVSKIQIDPTLLSHC